MKTFFIAMSVFLFLSIPVFSQDYSLDYGITGASGIVWESSDYKIVDFISDIGISQGAQSSADYSMTPVIGLEEETSSVSNWMLYL
ncbi:hypothetical protein JW926_11855 [Candidatus Sumerlaeota bacterium]|nr:hypothetical protein [Candidatus Sumerlaeota bacterium]